MALRVRVDQDKVNLQAAMKREGQEFEVKITRAVARTTRDTQIALRGEVAGALGPRVGNAVRSRIFPPDQPSARAAGLVYTRAPSIVKAFDEGATIVGKNGLWLAIPLPAAGKFQGNKRMTPSRFETQTGLKLRMVYLKGRSKALLVADGVRASFRGPIDPTTLKRRSWVATKAKRVGQTLPIFILVKRVKLPKLLDMQAHADAGLQRLAQNVTRELSG